MRNQLKESKRIVIKVGTSTLMYPNGQLNLRKLEQLVLVISDIQNSGKQVILVSSGAIGVGCHTLQMKYRPTSIPEQQAVASVGQSELMRLYSSFFSKYSHVVGQVLLTRDVVDYPASRQNVINTFEQLLTKGIIPIVNENDTVAVEELDHLTKFGDNDRLSAIVSDLTRADLLLMLSDVAGFYDKDPSRYQEATLFSQVNDITDDLMKLAEGAGTEFGTGGMQTKLLAARRVLDYGGKMILANGENPSILYDMLEGKDVGTLFMKEV